MDLLEDLKMSLLSFNFVMIYITHKILVFLKNKASILQCFFKELMDFNFFLKKYFFSQHIIMEMLSLEKEKIIEDKRNFFRLKKQN